MPITAISRDWADSPSIVRIYTTDDYATITTTGYLNTQTQIIYDLNHGSFEWLIDDSILVYYSTEQRAFFYRNSATNSLIPVYSSGGTVTAQQVQQNAFNNAADTGTANAYVASLSPAVTSLTEALPVAIKIINANTGASTLTIDGLGALPIVDINNNALIAGQLTANQVAYFVYNFAYNAWVLMNPSAVSTPSSSNFAAWDTNKNLSSNNFLQGYTTTATAAATTTLTVTSAQQQYFTGTTTQTVVLPVVSTLALGFSFTIVNNSTGVVTVQSSGGNTVESMASETQLVVTCISLSGTSAASWDTDYTADILPVPLSEGGTSAALTANAGGIAYSGTSALALTSAGTNGQVLTSNGSSAPTWQDNGYLANAVLLAPSGNQTITGNFTLQAYNLTATNNLTCGNIQVNTNTISSTNTNGNINLIGQSATSTVGIGSSTVIQTAGGLQVARGGARGIINIGTFVNSTISSALFVYKSRSTTIGSFATVNNGDSIFSLSALGDDGSQYNNPVAGIVIKVDGAPSTTTIPGRFEFSTTDNTGASVLALTINSTQKATFTSSIAALGATYTKVNGTESANAVTASGYAGVITTSSLSTAGAGNYAITWTNTVITATSVITLTIMGGTNTIQNITFKCVPGSGTATLTIYNNTVATALNGTILIGYVVN